MCSKNSEAPLAATSGASVSTNRTGIIDMTNVAVNQTIFTNPLIISDVTIHSDAEGRYSLNDLHKAAGNEERHAPNKWLRLEHISDLIKEILNDQICPFKSKEESKGENAHFKPVDSKRGRYGGTYVCRDLVYSYAMWISAKFHLKVIRAYDALITGFAQRKPESTTTTDERTPLRAAVSVLVGKRGIAYPEAYSYVHQRFAVEHIDELPIETLPEAIEYVHRLALEGEFIPALMTPPASLVPVFPTGQEFRFVTDIDATGRPISMTVLRPDEFIASWATHTDMLRHMGMIVIEPEDLDNMATKKVAMLIDAARKAKAQWIKGVEF